MFSSFSEKQVHGAGQANGTRERHDWVRSRQRPHREVASGAVADRDGRSWVYTERGCDDLEVVDRGRGVVEGSGPAASAWHLAVLDLPDVPALRHKGVGERRRTVEVLRRATPKSAVNQDDRAAGWSFGRVKDPELHRMVAVFESHSHGIQASRDLPLTGSNHCETECEDARMPSPQTLSEADRRIAAAWAADCAERVLSLFEAEAPTDTRPRDAIARSRAFSRGELDAAGEIRRRFVAGRAANAVSSPAAVAAARAAAQASGVAHMGAHALGAAAYAAKAAGLAAPDNPGAASNEIAWQLEHMSAPAASGPTAENILRDLGTVASGIG